MAVPARDLSTSSPDEQVELSVAHMLQRCHAAAAQPPLVQAQKFNTAATVQIQNTHAAIGCMHACRRKGRWMSNQVAARHNVIKRCCRSSNSQ